MKFKFKLEKVLQHRKILENLAQAEFSEAMLQLNKANDQLNQMLEQVHQSQILRQSILHESKNQMRHMSPLEQLKNIDLFLQGQKILIEKQQMKVEDARKTVEIRREILRNKVQDVKIIDKLKEKKQIEYAAEFEKEEQAQMDERATLRNAFKKF